MAIMGRGRGEEWDEKKELKKENMIEYMQERRACCERRSVDSEDSRMCQRLHSGLKLYEIDAFISYKKPLSHERGSERSERASERANE